MTIFSSSAQLQKIQHILRTYTTLPFSDETIPGALLEAIVANVRGGRVLKTYDFVDVISEKEKIGWQIKSTKETTPVTWKRAKIPNAPQLIADSYHSAKNIQKLGDEIITFCNAHAQHSMSMYNISEIGYSRLIVHSDHKVTYFEKILCTASSPLIFNTEDFTWHWSEQKKSKKKEQLPALHGIHRETQKKWWAWHGLGENQLHFSGEKNWWPKAGSENHVQFSLPCDHEKISLDKLISLLALSP